jgi:flagellar motor switch protein FliM
MDQNEIDKLLEEFSQEEKVQEEVPKEEERKEKRPIKSAELLSQEEIDALLKGLEEGEIPLEKAEEVVPEVSERAFERFDFRKWELIELERMKEIVLIFQRFARKASVDLSDFLHRLVSVEFSEFKAMYFEDFIKKVPVPTGLIILKVEPLEVEALLVLDAKTVFYAVDILFGGGKRGRIKIEGREFTPIETRIIRRISNILLEGLRLIWEPIYPLRFRMEKIELSPELVQAGFQRESILLGRFEVDLGPTTGSFSLCLPGTLVRMLRDQMNIGVKEEASDPEFKARFLETLKEVPVNLRAIFLRKDMRAEELLKLKVGDMITFPSRPDEELIVEVEGVPLLRGKAGISRGKRAVKITGLVE